MFFIVWNDLALALKGEGQGVGRWAPNTWASDYVIQPNQNVSEIIQAGINKGSIPFPDNVSFWDRLILCLCRCVKERALSPLLKKEVPFPAGRGQGMGVSALQPSGRRRMVNTVLFAGNEPRTGPHV